MYSRKLSIFRVRVSETAICEKERQRDSGHRKLVFLKSLVREFFPMIYVKK